MDAAAAARVGLAPAIKAGLANHRPVRYRSTVSKLSVLHIAWTICLIAWATGCGDDTVLIGATQAGASDAGIGARVDAQAADLAVIADASKVRDTQSAAADSAQPQETEAVDLGDEATVGGDVGSDGPSDPTPDVASCPPCPAGYFCFDGGTDAAALCLPDPAFACAPCSSDAMCLGGSCVFENNMGHCHIACKVGATGSSCPAGFGCSPAASGAWRCVPTSGTCSCTVAMLGKSQPCLAISAFGTCAGSQVCGSSGWGTCSAAQATAEVCNGQDDNCNGLTDEATAGAACGMGASPNCQGKLVCKGAAGLQCSAQPSPEACNGQDDDCNGATDEATAGKPCSVTPAANCQGATSCSNGMAGCAVKTKAETCNGQDDDCNGQTDDGGAQVPLPCAVSNTFGSCGGQTVCAAGQLSCSAKQPAAELCNNDDDNCDGQTDEGFTTDGQYLLVSHCGSCAVACAAPTGLHADATCTSTASGPGCAIVCEPGFVDMGGGPANGCECQYLSAVDEPDGIDQNCDGIDGEVDNAIFVAKTGADSNPGTLALPVVTLAKAMALATTGSKRDVYAAGGVYTGSIDLVAGISIYGGYGPGFGSRDTVIYQTAIVGVAPPGGAAYAVRCQGITGAGPKTRLDGVTILAANAKAPGESSYGLVAVGCDQRLQVTYCQVVAGDGAAGLAGSPGINGQGGLGGAPGLAAKDIGKDKCSASDHSPGGGGGAHSCGSQDISGGAGGTAVCPAMDEDTPTPLCPSKPYVQFSAPAELGKAGQGAGGGSGGAAGADSYIDSNAGTVTQCKGTISCNTCLVPVKPRDGDDGVAAGAAVAGAAGVGGLAKSAGSIVAGLWQAAFAGSGGGGGNGSGGGGGGAAGGVEVHDCGAAGSQYTDIGGSGGGGGAGGCGGSGGGGGQNGGASFAIAVFAGKAAQLPVIFGNALAAGAGGSGGTGGPAGSGGPGGQGGPGGMSGEDQTKTFCTSQGGHGGAGAAGGHGGGGGGGAGGPAGLLVLSGWPAGSATAVGKSNQLKVFVTGGKGGAGGPSIGQTGEAGANGLAKALWEL